MTAPLETPLIPQGDRDARLAAFDRLSWLLSVDAIRTADHLLACGGSPEAVADSLVDYRWWVLERIADALDEGIESWCELHGVAPWGRPS